MSKLLSAFRCVCLLFAPTVMLVVAEPAAAQYTWTGAFTTEWNFGLNWSPSGNNFPNGATATATFAGQGLGPINISPSVSAQALSFSNPTGNYTLTSSAGQVLSSITSITVAAGVTGVETINLANVSSGSLVFPTGNNLTITNNSTSPNTSLVIGSSTVIGSTGPGGIIVDGPGVTQISGTFASSGINLVSGGLTKKGTGTLILSYASNNHYGGGTTVIAGTLAIGTYPNGANGAVLPAGSAVTVQEGATLDLHNSTNALANALSNVTLTGGILQATGATNSDFYTQQLTMTGGIVNFANTPFTWIHLTGSGGIITNSSATTSQLIGTNSGLSVIRNDTANPMNITVAAGTTPSGIDLDAGIALTIAGQNSNFVISGGGTMRLTSLNNSANFTVNGGLLTPTALRVDDMAALGSGTITLNDSRLYYGGPTATSTKNLALISSPEIRVLTNGANLTLNGTISGGANLTVSAALSGPSSTLTLGATNTYVGATGVAANAILAIPTIANVGVASPIGSDTVNSGINLAGTSSRSTLLLIGTNATYSTDRTVHLFGTYPNGGAIGVQNAGTTLTWAGQVQSNAGDGTLIKIGPGTLTLTNTTNNYALGTYVEEGTLIVGANGAVIPYDTDVTVSSGATLQIGFSAGNNQMSPIRILTLNEGTLRMPLGSPTYHISGIVTGSTGGAVDLTGSTGTIDLSQGDQGITINGNSTWTGNPLSSILAGVNRNITIVPNTTLTSNISLRGFFSIIGGGTFYMTGPAKNFPVIYTVIQGRLRADDLSVDGSGTSVLGHVQPGFLTLNGGSLQYTGLTASTPMPIIIGTGGGAVEVGNLSTTLTVTGAITGGGVLTKSGPGVLILGNLANTYVGGITVSGGRLDVSADAQLGVASPTVNPAGTLRYTASATTARTFNLTGGTLEAPTGITLTLNGAAVNGGFLRGPGTYNLDNQSQANEVTSLITRVSE